MKIFNELKRTISVLESYPDQWAICGGVAASIYRTKPRFTDDIDFVLVDSPKITAEELATLVIKELNYEVFKEMVPNPFQHNKLILGLICARTKEDKRFSGIDFLLPVQFWVKPAVEFAQDNLVDFGFGVFPTITPESLLIAKIVALNSDPSRFQDLDDIKNILLSVSVDKNFVKREIEEQGLPIPKIVQELIN